MRGRLLRGRLRTVVASCLGAGVVAVAGLLGSCLFSSVGDNLEQAKCKAEPSSFCDELNTLASTGDDCQRWACDSVADVCKIMPRDLDFDGAPDVACVAAGVVADCDDLDGARTPGKLEVCDGIDNDCNQLVDDGAFAVSGTSTTLSSEDLEFFSYAQDPAMASDPLFLYGQKTGLSVPEARTAWGRDTSQVEGKSLEFNSASNHVASTTMTYRSGLGFLAAVANADGGNGELRVGIVDPPKMTGKQSTTLTKASHLSMAFARDSDVFLGSYLENAAKTLNCDSPDTPPLSPLKLFSGFVSSAKVVTLDEQEHTKELGKTHDLSPAAIVAAPGGGWLLAYVSENSTIEIKGATVTDTVTGIALNSLSQIDTGANSGEVDLALSPDGSRLTLVYRQGCDSSGKIHMVVFSRESSGALTQLAALDLATDDVYRRPSLQWREQPSPGWLVTWATRRKKVQLAWLSQDGELWGEPYEFDAFSDNMKSGPYIVFEPDNGLTLLAPTNAGLKSVHLSCQP